MDIIIAEVDELRMHFAKGYLSNGDEYKEITKHKACLCILSGACVVSFHDRDSEYTAGTGDMILLEAGVELSIANYNEEATVICFVELED